MEYFNTILEDPLSLSLKKLFGLDYLFPYQRLVISNILEAASSHGIEICWPFQAAEETAKDFPYGGEVFFDGENSGGDGGFDNSSIDEENDRRDLGRQIVILPTGAGKSLCFQLPAALLKGPTLVIYPILSLMADQERSLREKGLSPVLLRGGQTPEEREAVWEKIRSGESRFIIANPEVLLTAPVTEKLKTLSIVHLVIDEAHCVSEWGESFRPSYLDTGKIIEAASPPIVTAFTATASHDVLEKIEKYIFGKSAHRISGNPDRQNISYSAVGTALRDLAVRDLIIKNKRPAIVFCSSRKGTEKLARRLRNDLEDKEIKFYHAGLNREEKDAVEKWFFSNPKGILVSTCAYGMGVDKPDIRTVIHRDCPPSVEAYLQESGRAGRDGGESKAVLLWGAGDGRGLNRAKNETARKRFARLLEYARNTKKCRRDQLLDLLDYEAEREYPARGCCDVCGGKTSEKFREEGAVTDFIRRNKRSYTAEEAASILAAAGNIRCGVQEAAELLRAMIASGKLKESQNLLWKKRLTLP